MTIKRLNELREQHGRAEEHARSLLKAAEERRKKGEPAFTDEQFAAYERAMDDAKSLQERIADMEATLEQYRAMLPQQHNELPPTEQARTDLAMRALQRVRANGDLWNEHGECILSDEEQAAYRSFYRRSFNRYLRGGLEACSPEDKQFLAQHRAQSTTAAEGGYTIPDEDLQPIERAMKDFGGLEAGVTMRGVRRGPRVIVTRTGAALPFPTNNDTSNKGAILSENTQITEQDTTFGMVQLDSYAYTSKLIRVPLQLIQDSAVDIMEYIGSIAGERLGRATAEHYATGTGTGQPRGITVAVSVGKTAASATSITYNELLELKHSVNPAYRRRGAAFVMRDSTFLLIKKLQDSTGFPLWQPSPIVGEPDTLDGDPYIIDEEMPAATTGLKPIVYGDLSKYVIRRSRDMQLVRLVERYMDFLQVGIFVWGRFDADYIDASGGAVKSLQMA